MSDRKRVFVGMSGGVDSSASAYLLTEAGYDVTGVFIKVWEPPFLPCAWREERRDAQRVAAHLSIPLLTLDVSELYKREVVDRFVAAYTRGETPNPDVLCNKEIKFGAFDAFARSHGADLIATGHYARTKGVGSRARMYESADAEKDQTYFLWTVTQDVLRRTIFPIGHMAKGEVREIARRAGLPTAEKKDSQGICFLGAVDMGEFLREFIPVSPGDVLDEEGRAVGRHEGAVLYTLGARHGFSVRPHGPEEAPWFVVAKDIAKNTLTVAHRDPRTGKTPRAAREIAVRGWNIVSGESVAEALAPGHLRARLRYRQTPVAASWSADAPAALRLEESVDGVAPGQSVVLYRGDECLGGGEIASAR